MSTCSLSVFRAVTRAFRDASVDSFSAYITWREFNSTFSSSRSSSRPSKSSQASLSCDSYKSRSSLDFSRTSISLTRSSRFSRSILMASRLSVSVSLSSATKSYCSSSLSYSSCLMVFSARFSRMRLCLPSRISRSLVTVDSSCWALWSSSSRDRISAARAWFCARICFKRRLILDAVASTDLDSLSSRGCSEAAAEPSSMSSSRSEIEPRSASDLALISCSSSRRSFESLPLLFNSWIVFSNSTTVFSTRANSSRADSRFLSTPALTSRSASSDSSSSVALSRSSSTLSARSRFSKLDFFSCSSLVKTSFRAASSPTFRCRTSVSSDSTARCAPSSSLITLVRWVLPESRSSFSLETSSHHRERASSLSALAASTSLSNISIASP
mmetsp:Transcript_30301/g.72097  ORF Transcript_30301/g.72097 Transcript_30301/m.72097 type:complete len:386 (+) Transcript_30301:2094-3251(+)